MKAKEFIKMLQATDPEAVLVDAYGFPLCSVEEDLGVIDKSCGTKYLFLSSYCNSVRVMESALLGEGADDVLDFKSVVVID